MKEDPLFKKIKENTEKDRRRLETFLEQFLNSVDGAPSSVLIDAADGIAKLSDCLTRNSTQLIEIAKLKFKNMPIEQSELNQDDKNEMFEEIGEEISIIKEKNV